MLQNDEKFLVNQNSLNHEHKNKKEIANSRVQKYSIIIQKMLNIFGSVISLLKNDDIISIDKIIVSLKFLLVLFDEDKFDLNDESNSMFIIDFVYWKEKFDLDINIPVNLVLFLLSYFSLKSKYSFRIRQNMQKSLELKKKTEINSQIQSNTSNALSTSNTNTNINSNHDTEVFIKKRKKDDDVELKQEDYLKIYYFDFQHLKIMNYFNDNLEFINKKNDDHNIKKDKHYPNLVECLKYVNYHIEQLNYKNIKTIIKDSLEFWIYYNKYSKLEIEK